LRVLAYAASREAVGVSADAAVVRVLREDLRGLQAMLKVVELIRPRGFLGRRPLVVRGEGRPNGRASRPLNRSGEH
jgi:hypothetical protein